MMKNIPLPDLLATAEAAADAAAALLKKEYQRLRADPAAMEIRWKSSPMDPVTACDTAAQQEILRIIGGRFPEHRILAEEEGAEARGDPRSPYCWVIDPLDGTQNFIRGKEGFGPIVAVMKDDEIIAGCMVLPLLRHRFTAAKGQGAFADGQPVRLRKTSGMTDAILCSNITRRAKPDADGVLRVSIPACASVENYSCTAQALSEVLLGHNDGVFYRGLRLWDMAAGALMVAEAGGKSRFEWMEPGNPRGGVLGVASTAPIFDELCEFVFTKGLA